MFAQRQEIGRVAEHLRDLHGEERQRLRERIRLMQDAVLQVGHALAVQPLHRLPHAPPHRGHGVFAEVVVVALEQRLQQQPHLQVEQRLLVHGREHHTLHSDTSLSTSMGLAM